MKILIILTNTREEANIIFANRLVQFRILADREKEKVETLWQDIEKERWAQVDSLLRHL